MQYLKDVPQECTARNCRCILIEERLTGPRLKSFPIYEIVKDRSKDVGGQFDMIVYVDTNATGDLMKFAETVAINRGKPARVFSTVAEAKLWISDYKKEEN